MVVWIRVKRSSSDWPDQLLTNMPPDKGGAISPPFNSAPWQLTHLFSYSALPWAAWSAEKTPLATVRAASWAISSDPPKAIAKIAVPAMIRGRRFLMSFGLHKDARL